MYISKFLWILTVLNFVLLLKGCDKTNNVASETILFSLSQVSEEVEARITEFCDFSVR
jgi:hypothetical protein